MVLVLNATQPGLNIRNCQHTTGTNAFVIEATYGITSRLARPIQNHELLTTLGYEIEIRSGMPKHKNWKYMYEHITDIAPSHSFAPIFTALHFVETRKTEQDLKEK